MKKLVVLILIGAAGLVGYNYYRTGKITLQPSFSVSEEEQAFRRLEGEFRSAKKELLQGSRGASLVGLDTPVDVEGIIREVERVERELLGLKRRLTSQSTKAKVDRLLGEIAAFKQTHG